MEIYRRIRYRKEIANAKRNELFLRMHNLEVLYEEMKITKKYSAQRATYLAYAYLFFVLMSQLLPSMYKIGILLAATVVFVPYFLYTFLKLIKMEEDILKKNQELYLARESYAALNIKK